MSKVKKFFIGIILFAVATVAVTYGLVLYAGKTPTKEELQIMEQKESLDLKKYPIYEEPTELSGCLDLATNSDKLAYQFAYDFIKQVMEQANGSYIWVETEYYEPGVCYGVSKEIMKEKIDASLAEHNETGMMNSLEDAIRAYKGVVTNLTGHAKQATYDTPSGKRNMYWSYSSEDSVAGEWWRTLSAFKEAVTPMEYADQSTEFMKDNILLLKGLDLKIENPVVEKVMCIDWHAPMYKLNMMITADVTTLKKPEDFKKCKWIPAEGKTKKVTFVIMGCSRKQLNTHFITDVAVVGYN